MKIIRTQMHAMLDYGFTVILMLPWITNYTANEKDTIVFAGIGFLTLILSLITDYEGGLIKLIPMRMHLLLDLVISIIVMAMPLFFPMVNYPYYWPVLLGGAGFLVTILSSSKPYLHKPEDADITKPYH